jgi:succinoglycan biosynthesis protein ExoL
MKTSHRVHDRIDPAAAALATAGGRKECADQRSATIIYFVHDLTHPDVARRVELLQSGGASVFLIGFQRRGGVDATIANEVVSLGTTVDGDFSQRIQAVIGSLARLGGLKNLIERGNSIVARNLEMLVLGASARGRFLPGKPLIYECLDIHRLMVGDGLVSQGLRFLEARLMGVSQALVTSSPGFEREYFRKHFATLPPVLLVENKVYPELSIGRAPASTRTAGRPWRIGWFGVIRCRESLEMLTQLAAQAPGLIEVIIAGRPARGVFADLDAFKGRPGIRYVGEFADEEELGALFRSVDFAWAIDFYEKHANSAWLLPNRLYRSLYYGVPPIAVDYVETGSWLRDRDVGITVDNFDADTIRRVFEDMTPERHAALAERARAIPTEAVLTTHAEARRIVRALVDPSAAMNAPLTGAAA